MIRPRSIAVQGVGFVAIALATHGLILPSALAVDYPGCAHAAIAASVVTIGPVRQSAVDVTVLSHSVAATWRADTADADVSSHFVSVAIQPSKTVARPTPAAAVAVIARGAASVVFKHDVVTVAVRADSAAPSEPAPSFVTVTISRC